MTVAPLIAMKSSQVKSFDAVGRELDRRAHTYANDVDQSGRHIGYRCRAEDERPVPLEKAVRRLEVAIAGLARKLAPKSARMTTRALKRDLAALEEDMSPVTLASEARDAETGVGRLEVAIAGLARKLAPKSARMTTRALKRDLAALEEDMSPVTLASEARDAARASNARRGNVPLRDRGQSR